MMRKILTKFLAPAALLISGLAQAQDGGPHTTSVPQAVVGLDVTCFSSDGSASITRHGNGLMLRCDGFVLAPVSLFEDNITVAGRSEEVGKVSVSVIIHPGAQNAEKKSALVTKYTSRNVDYFIVRIKNFHSPAALTLLPNRFVTGSPINVYTANYSDATHGYEQVAGFSNSIGEPDPNDKRDGYVPFEKPAENVQGGSIVGSTDGMALGIIPGKGVIAKATGFISFESLDRVTNCVVPAPKSPTPEQVEGANAGMVHVPGGTVHLPLAVLARQPDMLGVPQACVAPFDIDKHQVTNHDYLEFWLSQSQDDRRRLSFQSRFYPSTWSKSGDPFPAEIENLPVLGVPMPGAMVYARVHGKRLPTPAEYCLAALGPKGDLEMPEWITNYLRDRQEAWYRIQLAHKDFYDKQLPQTQQGFVGMDLTILPWIALLPSAQGAAAWSKRTVEEVTQSVASGWKDPGLILPVGSRGYDTSVFGVQDVLLNGGAMVVPYPQGLQPGTTMLISGAFEFGAPKEDKNQLFGWGMSRLFFRPEDAVRVTPISRLYRRTVLGPDDKELLALASIDEQVGLMAPLSGFKLKMQQPIDITATAGIAKKLTNFVGPDPGLEMWSNMPLRFRREVGDEAPPRFRETHLSTGPQLYYHAVYGFRCVK
ncbi:MAG: SUMF1/EgtB/PvdO family nonheme iron enzyme [Chthonomonadales bacterium]